MAAAQDQQGKATPPPSAPLSSAPQWDNAAMWWGPSHPARGIPSAFPWRRHRRGLAWSRVWIRSTREVALL